MKNVTFIGWFENENMFSKDVVMEENDIKWATQQFADVNKALVKAIVGDKIVCTIDMRGK